MEVKESPMIGILRVSACGCNGNPRFDGVDPRYRRVLWAVIAINGAMFLVEMIAGQLAGSQALQADALDFLGDTLTYGISLAVIGRSLQVRSGAALLKGGSLLLMGTWVFGKHSLQRPDPWTAPRGNHGRHRPSCPLGQSRKRPPPAALQGRGCERAFGVAVLAQRRHRQRRRDDCRPGGWGTESAWPDLLVAGIMAGVFLTSSTQILRQAWAERREEAEAA